MGGPIQPAQSPPHSPTLPNTPTPAGRFTVRMGVVPGAGGRAGRAPTVTPCPQSSTELGEGANEPQEEAEWSWGSPLVKADIKNINLPFPHPTPDPRFPHPQPRAKAQSSEARWGCALPAAAAAAAATVVWMQRHLLPQTRTQALAQAARRWAGEGCSRWERNGRWSGRRVQPPGELPGSAPRPPCPG